MDELEYKNIVKIMAEECVKISKRDEQYLETVIDETVRGCEYVIYPKYHLPIYQLAENPTPFMLGDSLAGAQATAETLTQAVVSYIARVIQP